VHDLLFKTMNAIHHGVLAVSGGRLGWDFMNMPTLELTTTGRKSGQPRSVMLTSPVQEGSTLVIVGSRGGDDRHPAWYHNIKANPEVQVRWKGGPVQPMRARVATPEERARLWPLVVERYKGYGDYQTKTDREIPLVLLDPAAKG
jgi:deazaflavin-dependent oxidoreductase (nitroreductase family)